MPVQAERSGRDVFGFQTEAVQIPDLMVHSLDSMSPITCRLTCPFVCLAGSPRCMLV